jgi:general stress protein 26
MKRMLSVLFLVAFASIGLCHSAFGAEGKAPEMTPAQMKEAALKLFQSQPYVFLSTIDETGFPQTRAMANLRLTGFVEGNPFSADSLDTAFGTSAWRTKIEQLKKNPKASVYILDAKTYQAAILLGTIEIVSDPEIKKTYWSKTFTQIYPKGPTSPEYAVLRFKAQALKVHAMDHNPPYLDLTK